MAPRPHLLPRSRRPSRAPLRILRVLSRHGSLTLGVCLSLLLFLLLLLSSSSSSSSPSRGPRASALFRRRGGGEDEAEAEAERRRTWQRAAEEGGTDRYLPSRAGELLSTWRPGYGLEVDAWDPRTHDPTKDPASVGEAVQLKPQEQIYYLSAMVVNRVFKDDKFNITLYELRQWLEYMKYAGVSHVFWYDTAHSAEESQERGLRPYAARGFLTYHRFHSLYEGNLDAGVHFEQDQAALHCLNEHGLSTRWLLVADVDEYVFRPRDVTPGFLERYLRLYEEDFPEVSQLLLQSMLFVGYPQRPLPALVVERYQRRRRQTQGAGLFPAAGMRAAVRPALAARVHRGAAARHFEMAGGGRTVALEAGALRVNRYQGPRANGWQPDTEEYLMSLEEDRSMQPIADELRQILHVRQRAGVQGRVLMLD